MKQESLKFSGRASNPAKRKFSPAQLAAQKLFAERAKSGTLKKGKRKVNPDKRLETERVKSPNGIRPKGIGWTLKQAGEQSGKDYSVWERKFMRVGGVKTNPDKTKPRAYVKRASQATGTAPNKRLIARRKKALTGPAGYFPNPKAAGMMTAYQVICMHPKKHVIGVFKTLAQAKQIAVAMADLNNVTYAVKTVKVHKTHFAV